jgi:hypothetical protein
MLDPIAAAYEAERQRERAAGRFQTADLLFGPMAEMSRLGKDRILQALSDLLISLGLWLRQRTRLGAEDAPAH